MPLTPPPPVTDRAPAPPPGGTAPEHPGIFDAALGDAELHAARAALSQDRPHSARSLLPHTGDDWDRRGHRATVLAAVPGAHTWAAHWLLDEPGSADAATLLALALVHRALAGQEDPGRARAACRTAAGLAPADPTPWLGLLMLARAQGPEADLTAAFQELRARHPEHHHGHHLLIAALAERPPGGPESHEAYDAAERAAAEAPADSPLAVLPVVAYAERHRVLAAAGLAPAVPGPAPCAHWSGPRARRILAGAFDWWLEWEHDEHPRRHIDLNHLAFAMSAAGRPAEAAALFQRIGPHATPAPWSYTGQAPRTAFHRARAHALALGRTHATLAPAAPDVLE